MDGKKQVSSSCPYCGGGMRTSAITCSACNVEIRGRFRESLFLQLSDTEQQFLESFLLADFSIKELANRTGMGYQAIRTRLDKLIETYQGLRTSEDQKKRILDRVAQGEISATEGARLIRGLDHGRS